MYVISAASWVKVQSGETLTFDVKFPVAVIDSCLFDFSVAGHSNLHYLSEWKQEKSIDSSGLETMLSFRLRQYLERSSAYESTRFLI